MDSTASKEPLFYQHRARSLDPRRENLQEMVVSVLALSCVIRLRCPPTKPTFPRAISRILTLPETSLRGFQRPLEPAAFRRDPPSSPSQGPDFKYLWDER